MSAEIEDREAIARRLAPLGGDAFICAMAAMQIRDENIAAWAEEKMRAAEREAAAHEAQLGHVGIPADALIEKTRRIIRCEGQAVAYRAMVAKLRGAP